MFGWSLLINDGDCAELYWVHLLPTYIPTYLCLLTRFVPVCPALPLPPKIKGRGRDFDP